MHYSLNVNGLGAQNQHWNGIYGNRIIIYTVYIAISWNGTETQLEIMMRIECFEFIEVALHNYVCM